MGLTIPYIPVKYVRYLEAYPNATARVQKNSSSLATIQQRWRIYKAAAAAGSLTILPAWRGDRPHTAHSGVMPERERGAGGWCKEGIWRGRRVGWSGGMRTNSRGCCLSCQTGRAARARPPARIPLDFRGFQWERVPRSRHDAHDRRRESAVGSTSRTPGI